MSYPIGIRMGQWYKYSDLQSDWLPIRHSIIKARYRRRKRYPPVFKRRNQRDIFRPQNDGSQNLFRLWRKSVIRKQNTTDDIFGKAKILELFIKKRHCYSIYIKLIHIPHKQHRWRNEKNWWGVARYCKRQAADFIWQRT